jgi:DNA-binding NarL/FixJ family response regulator
MTRIGLTRVLQSAALRVVVDTADPVEGLAAARTHEVGLVVLGEQSSSVADVVRKAKASPPPPRVAVLVANAIREDLLPLLIAGADALLVRSIGPDELVDAVTRLLAGERVVSPALLPAIVGLLDTGSGDIRAPALLTAKERQVLARLADGLANDQIAEALFVSAATVKTHLSHIYAKLGARTRHEALARAVALGLLA